MAPWGQRTTSDFDLTVFAGGHFYLNEHLPQLAQWVEERVLAHCAGELARIVCRMRATRCGGAPIMSGPRGPFRGPVTL